MIFICEQIGSEMIRLDGMRDGKMAAAQELWMLQRLNILSQLSEADGEVWKAALGLATATRQLAGLAAITVEGLPKREYNSVYLPTLTQPGASGLLVPLSGEDSWRQDGENRERMAKKRAKMGEIWPKKKRAGGR